MNGREYGRELDRLGLGEREDTSYLQLPELLGKLNEPYRTACRGILEKHTIRMDNARGSTHNHQAWKGGYLDHICEIMNLAIVLYEPMNKRRCLPFSLSDALLVLFLHDLEKPWAFREIDGVWQRDPAFRQKEDAHAFRVAKLAEHGVTLPEHLERAVYFTEGEISHYSSTHRAMSPLAAFCHMCDVGSARIWFDFPAEHDDPWSGASRSF